MNGNLKNIIILVLLGIFIMPGYPGAEEDESLLTLLEEKYTRINSLSMNVCRTTYNTAPASVKQTPTVERWDFTFKLPVYFRIHYFKGDDERILAGNEKFIWEYVPQHNFLLETDIRRLPEEVKLVKFNKATGLVHIPFLLILEGVDSFDNIVVTTGPVIQDRPTILLTGTASFRNKELSGKIFLDSDRLNIVKTILTDDKNNDILNINYYSPEKVYQDIWFPKRMVYFLKKENLKTEVLINSISINKKYPKDFFKFKRIKGVHVWKQKAKPLKKEE